MKAFKSSGLGKHERKTYFYLIFHQNLLISFLTFLILGAIWKYLKAFKSCHTSERPQELYSFIYKQHLKSKTSETTADERRETVIDMETGCVENPPAKKQRTSEKSDEAENEVLASSVASLNVKLSDFEGSKVAAEEKSDEKAEEKPEKEEVFERTESEQTENVVADQKKSKITDFFKPK